MGGRGGVWWSAELGKGVGGLEAGVGCGAVPSLVEGRVGLRQGRGVVECPAW